MSKAIGILHPGEMGISLAATAVNSGMTVYWCAQGRSDTTRIRAGQLGITSIPTLQEICDTCDILVSVCPPHAATELADNVIACNYKGLFADVNAIAPATVKAIDMKMQQHAIDFVDGGIIGLPATRPGTTWLYLSGQKAEDIAACFNKGPLETEVLGNEIGQASGLKMCFAANSKGTAALHTAILSAAEVMGVRQALEKQWDIYTPGFKEKSQGRIRQVARKAWRFTGEMKEIEATLAATGLPEGFFKAAAEIYDRQASFKGAMEEPSIEDVLQKVNKKEANT